MKKLLMLSCCALLWSASANATPFFHMWTETDPGGANNAVLDGFDSESNLQNRIPATSNVLPNLPSGISVSGLAYNGSQYILITESDPGGLNNVVLSRYNSLTDLMNLNSAGNSSLPNTFPSGISISGLAYDGSQYVIITESDPGGLNNVVLSRYDSLTDLINLNSAGSNPLPNTFPSGISITGFAHDGSQYLIITESDLSGLNNMVLTRYDTLQDLVNLNSSGSGPMPSLPMDVSARGLSFTPDPTTGGTIPEPGTLAVFGLGLVGLGLARRRQRKAGC